MPRDPLIPLFGDETRSFRRRVKFSESIGDDPFVDGSGATIFELPGGDLAPPGDPGKRNWDLSAGDLVDSIERTLLALDAISRQVGEINITSLWRSPLHNRRVGGSAWSTHKRGEAADIWSYRGTKPIHLAAEIWRLVRSGVIPPGGLGVYRTFVHYDRRYADAYAEGRRARKCKVFGPLRREFVRHLRVKGFNTGLPGDRKAARAAQRERERAKRRG